MLLLVFRTRLRSDFDNLAEAGDLQEDTEDMDVVVAVESGKTTDLAHLEGEFLLIGLGEVCLPWGLFFDLLPWRPFRRGWCLANNLERTLCFLGRTGLSVHI